MRSGGNRRKTVAAVMTLLAFALAALIAVPLAHAGAATPGDPSDDGIQPVVVAGNPDCADLGYDNGWKLDGNPFTDGTVDPFDYNLAVGGTQNNIKTEITTGSGSTGDTVTIDPTSGTHFDWNSTRTFDAVIVKGGPNANSYVYNPVDNADGNLHPPINPNNSTPFGISHIEFCWNDNGNGGNGKLTVKVEKTAVPSVKRKFVWKVKKWATHKKIVLARKNDPGKKKSDMHLIRFAKETTVEYWVRAWAEHVDGPFRVDGVITVSVPGDADGPAEILSVTDVVSTGLDADVACERDLPTVLQAGDSFTCEYGRELPNGDPRENVATALAQVPDTPETQTEFKSDPVPFDFDDPIVTTTDGAGQAAVYDSRMGFLGWVRAPGPKTFHYSLLVKPGEHGAPLCGEGAIYNRASVVSKDEKQRDEDTVRIPVRVLCFEAAPDAKKDGGKSSGDKGGGAIDPKINPDDPGVSTNDKGEIDGMKSDDAPPIVCTPRKHYEGKRGGKGDPSWKMIGPKGMKTPFFRAGKKMTYRKMMRIRGKNPYHLLAGAYVRAKLHALSGVPVDAKTSRAMVWADSYFSEHRPRATNPKRKAFGVKAKNAKRMMVRHAKTLKRFNRGAKHYKHPGCASA